MNQLGDIDVGVLLSPTLSHQDHGVTNTTVTINLKMKTFHSPSETNYPALFLAKSFSRDFKFQNPRYHIKI